jgi:alpha-galactosidase
MILKMKPVFFRLPASVLAFSLATLTLAPSGFAQTPPPPAPVLRINGPKVFGVRPGAPFLFRIPATGERPITFSAEGLPDGLKLDPQKGQITGAIAQAGDYKVTLKVTNRQGSVTRPFRISVGEAILLTPPMGWNSWYLCSEAVSDEWIRKIAKAMVDSGLADHGWTYINIDDCWQGARGGAYNALQGNERFPHMRALCDYIHSLGLKMGIYSTPWIGSYAGFRGGSALTPEGSYEEAAMPADRRLQPNQLFGRYPLFLRCKANRVGPATFYEKDAKQWADWGIDYVKYDWNPIDAKTIEILAKSLRESGRDIAFSVSNGARTNVGEQLLKWAQVWRTGGDIGDYWSSVEPRITSSEWESYTGPGHWPDLDMLQVGMLGKPNTPGQEIKKTQLTPDEQYAHMSFWALNAAPLLLSCDLTALDPFTVELLTNDEVIDINQDPLGKPAVQVGEKGPHPVFMKPLENGSLAVGLFNKDATAQQVSVSFADLKLTGKQKVRDVWKHADLGTFEDRFQIEVPSHGVCLIQIEPAK